VTIFFEICPLIAKRLTFIHIHGMLRLLYALLLLLFALALAWLGKMWLSGEEHNLPISQVSQHKEVTPLKEGPHYDRIGEGAFKVSSKLKSFSLPDLKREICFLGKNTRPDATIYDLLIHIGLKGGGRSLKVVSGQKVYLAYIEGKKSCLRFSSEPTPLWIMPHLSESGETLVELGLKLLIENEERCIEEKKIFKLEELLQKEDLAAKDLIFQEAVRSLEGAKWWGPDRLFDTYGGNKYFALKSHERLEFFSSSYSEMVHVKEGDALVWSGGKWSFSKVGEKSRGIPLARLKLLAPCRMEWELWSADGLEALEVSHEKEKEGELQFRIEEVFSRIRERTSSRISCRIGNSKPTILKAGDWMLRTLAGWRVLKSLQEIEDVLSFQMRGELFIFDGIEKSEGKPTFSGILFDPMRTQQQLVKLPLASQAQKEHSSHKKKVISTKICSAAPEEEVHQESQQIRETRKRARVKVEKSPEGLKQDVD